MFVLIDGKTKESDCQCLFLIVNKTLKRSCQCFFLVDDKTKEGGCHCLFLIDGKTNPYANGILRHILEKMKKENFLVI